MAKGADVQSIDALGEAKIAMVEFLETVKLALSEGSSDVQRTITWLQSEKRTFWHHEVRRRTEKVNQAKSADQGERCEPFSLNWPSTR